MYSAYKLNKQGDNIHKLTILLKNHEILVLPIDAGNFAPHLEAAETHLQEGHLSSQPGWNSSLPCLHGSEDRGTGRAF